MCAVTIVALSDVLDPYAVVAPYSTCESDISFVVQVTPAPEEVMPDASTAEITGGVVSLATVTVIVGEVVVFPAASRARAARACDPARPVVFQVIA